MFNISVHNLYKLDKLIPFFILKKVLNQSLIWLDNWEQHFTDGKILEKEFLTDIYIIFMIFIKEIFWFYETNSRT